MASPSAGLTRGGRLAAIPEEQAILERIAACRAAGLSYREIAAELTAAGILTKQGKAAWTHTAIASIVKRAAARAALAALVDATRRLGPASRRRLGNHVDQEIEQGTQANRHVPPRRDPR